MHVKIPGWDTDQFPTDIYLTTQCMLSILKYGGLKTGAAKVLSPSTFSTRIYGGMDSFARGLKVAAAIRADGRLSDFVQNRYRSWDAGIGKDIEKGKTSFKQLEAHALKQGEPELESGRQEYLENLINEFI